MRALLLTFVAVAVIAATDAPQIAKVSWIYEVPKPGSSNPDAGASCSDIKAADPTAVHYWITGYFSGQNFDGGRVVGARTKESVLVQDVKEACRDRPSIPLSLATQAVYEKIQHDGL